MWRENISEVSDDTISDTRSLEPADYLPSTCEIPIENLSIKGTMEPSNGTMELVLAQVRELTNALSSISAKLVEHEVLLGEKSASATQETNSVQVENLFKIPDPIKMLPTFNGNKKHVVAWLNTAEETLAIFKDVVPANLFKIFFQAILNKIEGQARDVLCVNGYPSSFDELRDILINALTDQRDLSSYNCELWHNKMEGTIEEHFKKTKQIVFNFKAIARQNVKYNLHWDAINDFIDEYSLAAYMSGLKKPYFGFVQAACPRSIDEAHAFCVNFHPMK